MSKRLQVLLPDPEMVEIRRLARRDKVTVGEWVRRALREARSCQPVHDAEFKLKAIRKAVEYSFPTADIDQMLGRDRARLSAVIFIDSNIPMYLIGGPHPKKAEVRILVERLAAGQRLVTSAEVLQEVLHRCTAIDRRSAIEPAAPSTSPSWSVAAFNQY